MVVDPRKRACEARPSPWYVHPFKAHERGAIGLLVHYSRKLCDADRAAIFADVLFKLYGDYFRHGPRREGKKTVWYCPAIDQKGNEIDGMPDANNAVEWVEVDAIDSMLYYLSSADMFRLCSDFTRELELNTAGMTAEESRDELHRASNVLTAYHDFQMDDALIDAIYAHLEKRDARWFRGAPSLPETPPTRGRDARRAASCGEEKENEDADAKWRRRLVHARRAAKEEVTPSPREALALRRANSTRL